MPEQFTLETKVRLRADTERLSWKMEPDAQEAVEWLQFDNDNPAFFIVGYGATRRVESSSRVDESARVKSRLRRYQRVAGLFEDHMSLMPLSYWLPGFAKENKGRYSQVHTLINKLLPANCQIQKQATATSTGLSTCLKSMASRCRFEICQTASRPISAGLVTCSSMCAKASAQAENSVSFVV